MPVYVQHEVLGKVSDVFNAESIWQAPGLALFARRPLLRDLLERSPRELRGRAPTRCFSHVTLLLAQEELDDDRHLTRGARVRDLAQSLTALHQKDFGDLLGSDDVRYDVVGTDKLEPGEVEVRFGHAVYLPSEGESILYKVSTSHDGGKWQSACQIYLNQRLALIEHDQCAILLVNDGPEAAIEVQVRPKGAFDCSFDAVAGCYTITRTGTQQKLLMKVMRSGAPAVKPAAVWKTRAGPIAESEQTAVPFSHRPMAGEADATFAPLAQQRVTLVGLALPRLSRYRDTGATGIEIGLDAQLGISGADGDSTIRFTVDANDTLHAMTSSGRQAVTAPASFAPMDGAKVELLAMAPAMAERYCATLLLPHQASMPVASGARLVFGRSAPMLAALRVLDSPRFLQRDDGAQAASADRLGLSRSAFSFEAAANGYKIGRMSASQALFHLDAELALVGAIGNASADQPYLLPHGHHLVAGHYVLRFDA